MFFFFNIIKFFYNFYKTSRTEKEKNREQRRTARKNTKNGNQNGHKNQFTYMEIVLEKKTNIWKQERKRNDSVTRLAHSDFNFFRNVKVITFFFAKSKKVNYLACR